MSIDSCSWSSGKSLNDSTNIPCSCSVPRKVCRTPRTRHAACLTCSYLYFFPLLIMKELSTKLSSTLLRTGRAAKTEKPTKRHHSLYPEVQQSGFPSVLGEPMCRTEGHRTLGMGCCSVLWAPGVSGSLTHLLASVPISHCHTGHTQTTRKQCSHLHQPRHLVRR